MVATNRPQPLGPEAGRANSRHPKTDPPPTNRPSDHPDGAHRANRSRSGGRPRHLDRPHRRRFAQGRGPRAGRQPSVHSCVPARTRHRAHPASTLRISHFPDRHPQARNRPRCSIVTRTGARSGEQMIRPAAVDLLSAPHADRFMDGPSTMDSGRPSIPRQGQRSRHSCLHARDLPGR